MGGSGSKWPERPAVTGRRVLFAGRWIELAELDWRDRAGRSQTWEAAGRPEGRGAVMAVARLLPSGRYALVRQFRPAVGGWALEFPAGLVDPGETEAAAAVRELREETGYAGSVVARSPPMAASPGILEERCSVVFLEVDEADPANLDPRQSLGSAEDIEVLLALPSEVPGLIAARHAAGDVVDLRVFAFFTALP